MLLTKKGSTKQHRHCPKRTKVSNISPVQHADLGVPNSPFQGRSESTPHAPPQLGHSFSGHVLNLIKCGIVIKGTLTRSEHQKIEEVQGKRLLLGIPIVESVKYLGVCMGNVSSDEAFAFPLGEA